MREIKQILVDGQGWVYATESEPIEWIGKNGEMAIVDWYKKGNKEFNGKYVIEIDYKETK